MQHYHNDAQKDQKTGPGFFCFFVASKGVRVSINVRGTASNKVLVKVKP